MKTLITAIFLATASLSHAQAPQNGMNFEQHKQKILQAIDERIALLNQSKACVSQAQNKEGLKQCHQASKQNRSGLHEKFKQMRMEGKQHKIQNLQEKMQKLQNNK